MGRDYFDELGELRKTWELVRSASDELFAPIRHLLGSIGDLNARFIGSGGARALAELAALEHSSRTGRLAIGQTPLQLAPTHERDYMQRTAVVIFSSRARHPDVALAAKLARDRGAEVVALVTQLAVNELPRGLTDLVDVAIPMLKTTSDGFLATNSLLAMGAAWIRSTGATLPGRLPGLDAPVELTLQRPKRLLVIYGPEQCPAAIDLEARISETGIADVQIADLRNLAHGRHVSLARRANETLAVAISGPQTAALQARTLAIVGLIAPATRYQSELGGSLGALDGITYGMRIFGELAREDDSNPGRPRVSSTGRRLYHLRAQPVSTDRTETGMIVSRKLRAAGASLSDQRGSRYWVEAFRRWHKEVDQCPVRAVVLDYDGTFCESDKRFEPPAEALQRQVTRLLRADLRVAFASGRGQSLPQALREWVPKTYWTTVLVGIYNGSEIYTLDQDVERRVDTVGDLAEAARRITNVDDASWRVEVRRSQITVTSNDQSPQHILGVVRAVLARDRTLHVTAVASGHSVDVFSSEVSKQNVATAFACSNAHVMTVGDQGDESGNDFELLAYSPLSLSVDRVSPDPLRCWNLGVRSEPPTRLTQRYLEAIKTRGRSAHFSWPMDFGRED